MRVMPRVLHRRVKGNRVGLIAVVAASAACLAAPGAALAGNLDQQQTDITGAPQGVNANGMLTISAAQTFTAGIDGDLDQVDLAVQQNGVPTLALTVELRATTAGEPSGTVLATKSVPASVVIGSPVQFVPIVFPTPAPVVAGTQYAIVAYTADTSGYTWRASPYSATDPTAYEAGAAFFAASSPPSTAWLEFTGVDQAFKTYVAPPTTAPPPSSPAVPVSVPTGQRAAALKKCKKKRSKQARKKCKRKAMKLPL